MNILKLLKILKRKWIKGECRKLCLFCPYWKRYCKHDFDCSSKYDRGYADGYDDGYTDAMERMERYVHK